MGRQRDPRRDQAFDIWKKHNGEITNRAIADQLGLPERTIGGWKSKDNWNGNSNGVLQKNKRSTPKKKQGGQPKNKNAKGHGAPKANQNAIKHGLFAKYLPKETLQIVYQMDGMSPVDILWMNIEMQFAQILHSQQIMHVNSRDDKTKELKRQKETDSGWEKEYEIQFAWDKQASFLTAISRAMTTLQGLFKQFDEMANADDERRLRLEQMKLNIKKTNAEVEKLTKDDSDKPIEILIKRKGERT